MDGPYVEFFNEQEGNVYIERRCPECRRFIKAGRLFINSLDEFRLDGWVCKKHGEVKPHLMSI